MAMSIGQDRARVYGPGVMLGTVGMSAYFLPVTKDRFVRNAFAIQKELTEDKIDKFTRVAEQISKKNLQTENRIFLLSECVAESIDAIGQRCLDLGKSITDSDAVQTLKKGFEDNILAYKKSEAMMDNVASSAFKRIRWTNFAWGIGIGFLIGSAIRSGMSKSGN